MDTRLVLITGNDLANRTWQIKPDRQSFAGMPLFMISDAILRSASVIVRRRWWKKP